MLNSIVALFGCFSGSFLIISSFLFLLDLHLYDIQLLRLLQEISDLSLKILLLDCYVCNIDNLDSLERLLGQQVLILALLHLQGSDLSKLLLDKVFPDLDATANVFEQVNEGDALLVHPLVDAD